MKIKNLKERLVNLSEMIFSVCTLVALAGGALSAALFLIAMLIGIVSAETASSIAVFTRGVIIPYCIKIAAVGMFGGLLSFYLQKVHMLSMDSGEEE